MNWRWNFREVPIHPRHLVALVLLIALSYWAQSGFSIDKNHLLFFISNYSIWLLLLPSVYELSKLLQRPVDVRSLLFPAITLILTHWVSSNIMLYALRYLFGLSAIPEWQEVLSFLLPSLASRLIDLSLFAGLLSWLHQQRTLSRQKVLMAESQALLDRSKLQSLKNQLNPHFLFNALHSVNTLIGIDPDRASEMIIKVSQLLRSVLTINEREEHTLKEEIDFVRQYLDIESERFKDRLSIEMELDEQSLYTVIPAMTLQPLVENAFKHGISGVPGPTSLYIQVKQEETILKLLVSNDIPASYKETEQSGIGLTNLEDRLKAYYKGKAQLDTKIQDHQFQAKITIAR
ncbi:MAG: histidine kinase [Cytophagales bacterium]|nr:histidine kinase [Cytophagales bacterium]